MVTMEVYQYIPDWSGGAARPITASFSNWCADYFFFGPICDTYTVSSPPAPAHNFESLAETSRPWLHNAPPSTAIASPLT